MPTTDGQASSAAQDRWPDGSADECPKCGFLHAYDRSCEDHASAAQGRFELHIVLPVASRDDAMGLARKAFDAVSPYAQSVTVHEEKTMPILKQVGSIGVSRG